MKRQETDPFAELALIGQGLDNGCLENLAHDYRVAVTEKDRGAIMEAWEEWWRLCLGPRDPNFKVTPLNLLEEELALVVEGSFMPVYIPENFAAVEGADSFAQIYEKLGPIITEPDGLLENRTNLHGWFLLEINGHDPTQDSASRKNNYSLITANIWAIATAFHRDIVNPGVSLDDTGSTYLSGTIFLDSLNVEENPFEIALFARTVKNSDSETMLLSANGTDPVRLRTCLQIPGTNNNNWFGPDWGGGGMKPTPYHPGGPGVLVRPKQLVG